MIVFESPTDDCGDLTAIAICGPVTGECGGSLYEANIPVQPTSYYFLIYTTDPAGCGDFTFSYNYLSMLVVLTNSLTTTTQMLLSKMDLVLILQLQQTIFATTLSL
ncbi:MAG: hypothetical protein R2809_13940 [Flavobacteriales bacterium]